MKNSGKELELLVTLIQKHIEPEAAVEHNIHLPVINSSSGRTRQCDIVITSGPNHRRTITIGEVQDRSSQVDINTFSGWLSKLDEVGAQHLICVSRLEFPESIKEKAFSLGNKVKLINIKDADPTEIPFGFLKTNFKYHNYQATDVKVSKIKFSRHEANLLGIFDSINEFMANEILDLNSTIFSFDKVILKSIYNICQESSKKHLSQDGFGDGVIVFEPENENPLFFYIDGQFTRIGMKLEFNWTNEILDYPVTVLSYEQQSDGSLAWILEGKYETPGGKVSFKVPLIKKDNYHEIPGLILNMENPHEFAFGIVNEGETKI